MKLLMSINAAWNVVNFRAPLIRALQAAGHEVEVATPADGHEHKFAAMDVKWHRLDMAASGMSPVEDAALYRRYRRLFAKVRPDAYLGYTIKPNVYGSFAAHAYRVPTLNNISGLGTAFIREGALGKLVRGLYRRALAPAHTVFFQNPEDRDLFAANRLVKPEAVRLLPGSGIDLQHFQPPAAREPGPPRLLFVGRMLVDKGVGELIEAARIVRRSRPEVRFELLGFAGAANRSAIGLEQIEAWQAEGLIHYLGSTDDVRPYVARADAVLLPSYREGLPRSLLEAAAMGRPLIASDVPGCRHIVAHGDNGLLCEVRSGAALAEAITAFLAKDEDARGAMGAASRRIAETRFDERLVFQSYLEALASIRFP